MTRVTPRRLCLIVLAAVHFLAAPCVMAMSMAGGEDPCSHCGSGAETAPCAKAEPAVPGDDVTPASVRPPSDRDPPRPVSVLTWPRTGLTDILGHSAGGVSATRRVAFRTGRHGGDPPLNLVFGRFLN